jgi:uncharacterized protein (DUF433 family)
MPRAVIILEAMHRTAPSEAKLLPAYSLAEVARVVGMNPSTLRTWFRGREYSVATGTRRAGPVARPTHDVGEPLSFIGLVEAHMLSTIRRGYGIPLSRFRKAMDYLREKGGDLPYLAHRDFFHDKQHLYLQADRHLISLSEQGQHVERPAIEDGLRQLEYGTDGYVDRFYPRVGAKMLQTIVFDPTVAFGRPSLARLGVAIEAIGARFQAGEPITELMSDYGAKKEEIEDALRLVGQAA